MSTTQWWISTDMIGKPGSPKTAGPFSTRDDAFNARTALEAMGANLSVFEEEVQPVVELPSEPMLGWLGVTDTGSLHGKTPGNVLGIWQDKAKSIDGGPVGTWSHEYVTAFTPATAVPTAALDELRAAHEVAASKAVSHARSLRYEAVAHFLTAIKATR